MKRLFTIGCLTMAAATCMLANTEKIRIYNGGELFRQVYVEQLDKMTYSNPSSTKNFTHLDFRMNDGSVTSVPIDNIQNMEYAKGLGENPLDAEITIHHMSATVNVTASDPNALYRISGQPAKNLEGYDPSVWAEKLFEIDRAYMLSVAEEYGVSLADFDEDQIFWKDNNTIDWFPWEIIEGETPIALCLYTAEVEGNDVVMTSEPKLFTFTTKKVEDTGVTFALTADMTSTSLTVIAEPSDPDTYYAIELYDPVDVLEHGLQYLVGMSLLNMEKMVYNYGSSWDEILYKGHGERTYKNMKSGDIWLAVAFGVEYGVATTDASKEFFEIPVAFVVDDCTFSTTQSQVTPAEVNITVTPSNPDTRYAAFIVETEKLEGENAKELYISNQVYWNNIMNRVQWTDPEYVFSGEATLSTYSNMFGGKYLKADTDYTVLICGVDETGTQTTEIETVAIRTSSQVTEEVTFDITFSDFSGSDKWTHYLTIKATPSDPNAQYVFEYLKASNAYANLNCTDTEFVDRYVDAQGQYLNIRTGEVERKCALDSEWANGGTQFGKYIVFIFGYDGGMTGPLYVYEIDSSDGTVTQLRGPRAE